jgi:hypothetical protein
VQAEFDGKLVNHRSELSSMALSLKIAANGNQPNDTCIISTVIEPCCADRPIVELKQQRVTVRQPLFRSLVVVSSESSGLPCHRSFSSIAYATVRGRAEKQEESAQGALAKVFEIGADFRL